MARLMKRNFPHTCWMNFLSFLSSKGMVDSIVAYCLRAPYLIGVEGKDACCGSCGHLC